MRFEFPEWVVNIAQSWKIHAARPGAGGPDRNHRCQFSLSVHGRMPSPPASDE